MREYSAGEQIVALLKRKCSIIITLEPNLHWQIMHTINNVGQVSHHEMPECSSCLLKSRKNAKSWRNSSTDAEDASCSYSLVGCRLHPIRWLQDFFHPLQFTWTSTDKGKCWNISLDGLLISLVYPDCVRGTGHNILIIMAFQFSISAYFRYLYVDLRKLPNSMWILVRYNWSEFLMLKYVPLGHALPVSSLDLTWWPKPKPCKVDFPSSPHRTENYAILPGDSIKHYLVKSLLYGGRIEMYPLFHWWLISGHQAVSFVT